MGDNAGRLAVIEKQTPAGARAEELSFGQMLKRAEVLARSELVPKALQGKPEAIVLVGAKGAELGVPFIASLTDIHVIEGSASPSAQLRLALLRRAGHEARFVESDEEKAVIRGRRREYRDDPNAWVTVTWTIEQARRAGLLDVTYERWVPTESGKRRPMRWVEGSTPEPPEWITKPDVEIKRRENWWRYPAEMLRARAASALCRMEFSDVLSGLGVDPFTPEEHGMDVGQDVDEPVLRDDPDDDDIADAEIVEQGEDPGLRPEQAPGGADQRAHTGAASEPAHPGGGVSPSDPPAPSGHDEQPEVYDNRRRRANAVMGEVGVKADDERHQLVHTATGGATQSTARLTAWQVEAIVALCDRLKAATTDEPAGVGDNGAQVVGAAAPPPPGPGDWPALAKAHGVTVAGLLRKGREFAEARGVPLPASIEEVTDEQVVADIVDWLGEPL